MTSFNLILKEIKQVKVQGAENVAKAGAKALLIAASQYKDSSGKHFNFFIDKTKNEILRTRPTEPMLRNTLKFLTLRLEYFDKPYDELKEREKKLCEHLEQASKTISVIGSKKIKNGDIVFTHCHSSAVVNILKAAKKEGKRFSVHNTETRPLFQGRITARELVNSGIPVVHYIAEAARLALKKADIMLIGADAISSEGKVINKIGSELFAEVAQRFNVPVYVCTNSWKFDPLSVFGYDEEIEIRPSKEVWPTAPKGVKIDNYAFEKVDPDLISGVISEIGVYKPEVFVEEVKKAYPWLF